MDNSGAIGTSGAIVTLVLSKDSSNVSKLAQLGSLIKELTGKDAVIKTTNR